MERIRLSAPTLDFWVDVCVFSRDNRWLAIAWLTDEPEIGLATSRVDAIRRALQTLGAEAEGALLEMTRTTT